MGAEKFGAIVECDCGEPDCHEEFRTFSLPSVVRKQAKAAGWRVRRETGTNHWFSSGHVAAWEFVTQPCQCRATGCAAFHRSHARVNARRAEMKSRGWTKVRNPDKGTLGTLWIAPGHTPAWKVTP